jgi:hypothetical protein
LNVRLEKVPRPFPLGFVLGLVGGAALAGFHFLQPYGLAALGRCRFKDYTGWPCPSCGGTRSIEALFRGRLAESFTWNPLVCAGVLVLAAWFLLSLGLEAARGREMTVELTRGETWAVRGLVVALPLADWIYLAAREGRL